MYLLGPRGLWKPSNLFILSMISVVKQVRNVGGMLEKVRLTMAQLTNKIPTRCIHPRLASRRCSCPYNVKGGLAGEFSMEQAVGIASMVKSDHLQMEIIAKQVEKELGVPVKSVVKRLNQLS